MSIFDSIINLMPSSVRNRFGGKSKPEQDESVLHTLRLCDANKSALRSARIRRKHIGDIILPSGQISAADGQTFFQAEAVFFPRAEPGTYPVYVYIVGQGDEKQVAAAEVRLRDGPIAFWAPAARYGQCIESPDEYGATSYGVDTATGCFTSPEALTLLKAQMAIAETQAGDDFDFFEGVVSKSVRDKTAFMYKPTKDSDLNIAFFETGEGDGSYHSYFGLNDSGMPVNLVTVFFKQEQSS